LPELERSKNNNPAGPRRLGAIPMKKFAAIFPSAQRDCRKTPGPKNVHKNLPQQAEKLPKGCQNVLRNIKNKALFNVSLPLFKDQFLKRDFFDSFNGSCISF
jgi:hypothetical protein